ncbi:MAG TPA: hypothetical protein VHB21_12980 [Minicystis sp.]|nr:hypothetical protein [Minicystis sp.]
MRDAIADAARRAIEEHGARIAKEDGVAPSFESVADPRCASVTDLADIDGDGAPDADVSVCLEQGIHAWEHFLYFSNHGCPRFADHLVNAPLEVRREKHHGVADLEANWAGGCAGGDFGWYHFAWTGRAYRVIDHATCHLCDDGEPRRPGENTHWKCQAVLRARRAAKP